jgi:hypothetical protein
MDWAMWVEVAPLICSPGRWARRFTWKGRTWVCGRLVSALIVRISVLPRFLLPYGPGGYNGNLTMLGDF